MHQTERVQETDDVRQGPLLPPVEILWNDGNDPDTQSWLSDQALLSRVRREVQVSDTGYTAGPQSRLSRRYVENLSRGLGEIGLPTWPHESVPQRRSRLVLGTRTRSRINAKDPDTTAQHTWLGLQEKVPPHESSGNGRAEILERLCATTAVQTHAYRLHATSSLDQVASIVSQVQASQGAHSCASGASERLSGAENVSEKVVGDREDTGACSKTDRAKEIQEDQVRVSVACRSVETSKEGGTGIEGSR